MSPPDRAALHTLEQIAVAQGRKAQKAVRIIAYSFFVIAIVLGAIPPSVMGPKATWAMKGAVAGVVGAIGIVVFLATLRDPLKRPAIAVLRARPGDVVWLYVNTVTQYGKPMFSALHLGLVDGKRLALNADLGREDELVRAAQAVAPHATVGFTPEHEAAFLRTPASLRRS